MWQLPNPAHDNSEETNSRRHLTFDTLSSNCRDSAARKSSNKQVIDRDMESVLGRRRKDEARSLRTGARRLLRRFRWVCGMITEVSQSGGVHDKRIALTRSQSVREKWSRAAAEYDVRVPRGTHGVSAVGRGDHGLALTVGIPTRTHYSSRQRGTNMGFAL